MSAETLPNDSHQPDADSHDWVLPDNFHVHVRVTDKVTKFVQFQDAPHAVDLNVNKGTKEGRSISPNIIHSIDGLVVREMHRRCDYDPELIERVSRLCRRSHSWDTGAVRRKHDKMVEMLWGHYLESGFLSTRVFDYLGTRNMGLVDHKVIQALVSSLPEKPFPVLSIHDCFRAHPNKGDDLRRQYNHILSEIAGSDLLAFIASQVTGKPVSVTKMGNISKQILDADYTLC